MLISVVLLCVCVGLSGAVFPKTVHGYVTLFTFDARYTFEKEYTKQFDLTGYAKNHSVLAVVSNGRVLSKFGGVDHVFARWTHDFDPHSGPAFFDSDFSDFL